MSGLFHLLKIVFASRTALVVSVLSFIFFFSFFILLPVLTITGNTLDYQLSLLEWKDYLIMVLFAVLASLNVTLQSHNFRSQQCASKIPKSFVRSIGSGVVGIFGGILGTMKCVSCFAVLLGFLGVGSGVVFFIVKNQSVFLGAAIILLIVSLYFEVRKVNGVCSQC